MPLPPPSLAIAAGRRRTPTTPTLPTRSRIPRRRTTRTTPVTTTWRVPPTTARRPTPVVWGLLPRTRYGATATSTRTMPMDDIPTVRNFAPPSSASHRGPPLPHAAAPAQYYLLHPPYGGKAYLHEEKDHVVSSLPPVAPSAKHQSPVPPVATAQAEDKAFKPQFQKEDAKQSHLAGNGSIAPFEDGVQDEKAKATPDKENIHSIVNGKASTYSAPTQPTTTTIAPTAAPTTATSTTTTCTCKKSRCLKLYCQCFSTNALCNPLLCRCDGCYNTAEHVNARRHAMRTILQRNPGAFRSKFVPADGAVGASDTKGDVENAAAAASASTAAAGESTEKPKVTTHKNGCKCRKSACLKKYCECFNADTKCGPNCRCLGCKNLPVGGGNNHGGRGAGVSNGKGAWMMDAAQNLAFLKHASPHAQRHPPYPPQHHYLRSITESPAKPMRHAPSYPPPPQSYYHYNMPPQQQQQQQQPAPPQPSRTEQTPPRATGSFNNDDSPSGLAVNTLLMAAYAMTELDGRKDDEKGDDTKPAEVSPAPGVDGAGTAAPAPTNDSAQSPPQSTVSREAQASHGCAPTPTKNTAQPQRTDIAEPTQPHVAATPTKNTVSLPSEVPRNASLPSDTTTRQTQTTKSTDNNDTTIDTIAPPLEERPSAEVSPDNSDEKSRKRTHSAMEEEYEERAPSSFSPPKRSDDTKIELFRKSSNSIGTIPLPERNVSADSDDVTAGCGKGVEDIEGPPAKRASVETAVQ
eukprot:CCRYP_013012-RA/>CCRYP_013012-RA protein AED:0.01 eAED:0.01 QI:957/1/1/1/1/1/2/150/745